MFSYVIKKLITAIPILVGVTLMVFLILHLTPGDPALVILGQDATPEAVEALREKLGLNDPLPVQYLRYLNNLLHGDLGTSIRTNQPVTRELMTRFPNTVELAFVSLLFATVLGLLTGTIAAVKRGTWIDTVTMTGAVAGVSAPSFWLGLMFMLLFAYYLHWLPASGRGGPLTTWAGWSHIMLPAITLGLGSAATLARITRSSLLDVMAQDYVRTARAKGLKERLVIYRHALRNALVPVVTIVGLQLGFLLGGAVVTEQIFAWPGIGTQIITAIGNRDFPVVQGAVLLIAVTFVLVNLAVDILYYFVDPRIRYD
ncbi:MAG: ABC transporter permease [Clostridiales bacterium]|nr:ABC transporter permease [Clostridiales bacterium]